MVCCSQGSGIIIITAWLICASVPAVAQDVDLPAGRIVDEGQMQVGRYTTTVLAAHQLAPLLDRVVSGDTLPTKKPDPAGIESCIKAFGVPPHRVLFVGDSSIDVATARNAGIDVWALPYGYNRGQPIEASAPDRVIADCSLLLN